MFAIIETGGKQYRVHQDGTYKVEKLAGEVGQNISFNEILMIGEEGQKTLVGAPFVEGAEVQAEIVDQFRDKKVIIFKKKRRQHYRRKNGHRQSVTLIKITGIKN